MKKFKMCITFENGQQIEIYPIREESPLLFSLREGTIFDKPLVSTEGKGAIDFRKAVMIQVEELEEETKKKWWWLWMK